MDSVFGSNSGKREDGAREIIDSWLRSSNQQAEDNKHPDGIDKERQSLYYMNKEYYVRVGASPSANKVLVIKLINARNRGKKPDPKDIIHATIVTGNYAINDKVMPKNCCYVNLPDYPTLGSFFESFGMATPVQYQGRDLSVKDRENKTYKLYAFNAEYLKILDPSGYRSYSDVYDGNQQQKTQNRSQTAYRTAPQQKTAARPQTHPRTPATDNATERLRKTDAIYNNIEDFRMMNEFFGLNNGKSNLSNMQSNRMLAHDVASGTDVREALRYQRSLDFFAGDGKSRGLFRDEIADDEIAQNVKKGMSLGEAIAYQEQKEDLIDELSDTLGDIAGNIFGL